MVVVKLLVMWECELEVGCIDVFMIDYLYSCCLLDNVDWV